MNILLTDKEREQYKPDIDTLFVLCREMMQRKYERANVQQGYVFNMVCNFLFKDCKILCVGAFEDTAYEALKTFRHDVIGIDPQVNISLDSYFNTTEQKFDIIFSTSVLEHVENDELFIDQICKLLNKNGIAILTCDFKNGWKEGDSKPSEDFRLYTEYDLTVRLPRILKDNGCSLYGVTNYDGEPDFDYGLHHYNFATFTFKKD